MKTETRRELFHKFPAGMLLAVLAATRLLGAGKGSQVTVLARRLQVWMQDALGSARQR